MSEYSIVEYFAEHEGYRCGYCKSKDTNYSHGMWAHSLTVQNYQDLIDRGWRRSGKYCYKPTMNLTCCPQYTIRCAALDFKLSKSQKKVLKKVHKYLSYGRKKNDSDQHNSSTDMEEGAAGEGSNDFPDANLLKKVSVQAGMHMENKCVESVIKGDSSNSTDEKQCSKSTSSCSMQSDNSKKVKIDKQINPGSSNKATIKTDVEFDSNKPRPNLKKAKLIRKERKLQKLMEKAEKEGMPVNNIKDLLPNKKCRNEEKTLEDFLSEPFPENPAHKLEIKLLRSFPSSSDFTSTFDISHQLFKCYQMAIHEDTEDECDKTMYSEFLVKSPLQPSESGDSNCQFGSFHQQYWLDNKLIAVGVIDILPNCVSSVYFYYDPEYSFLSLGTYAALRELAFIRELHKSAPDMCYYYMGFYIHSCIKMKYKGQYYPSFLLCPESYTWNAIEKCRPKLDNSKYCRLEESPSKDDTNSEVYLNEILILNHGKAMTYPMYKRMNSDANDDDEVRQYGNFVGRKCYSQMLLYRS